MSEKTEPNSSLAERFVCFVKGSRIASARRTITDITLELQKPFQMRTPDYRFDDDVLKEIIEKKMSFIREELRTDGSNCIPDRALSGIKKFMNDLELHLRLKDYERAFTDSMMINFITEHFIDFVTIIGAKEEVYERLKEVGAL
jgi:hypothetical protein